MISGLVFRTAYYERSYLYPRSSFFEPHGLFKLQTNGSSDTFGNNFQKRTLISELRRMTGLFLNHASTSFPVVFKISQKDNSRAHIVSNSFWDNSTVHIIVLFGDSVLHTSSRQNKHQSFPSNIHSHISFAETDIETVANKHAQSSC